MLPAVFDGMGSECDQANACSTEGSSPVRWTPGSKILLSVQVQPPMARELFPAGFVSCWSELDVEGQEALVRSLEAALASPSIPPDLVTSLLNLAEFMEHDDKSLPLDIRYLPLMLEHVQLWGI